MREHPNHPNDRKSIQKYLLLITYAIVVFLLFYRIETVFKALRWLLDLFAPFLIGIGFAYLLNMPMRFYERTLFSKWHGKPGIRRSFALTLSFVSVLAVIGGIVALIVPPFAQSVGTLANNFSSYLIDFDQWWLEMQTKLSLSPAVITWFENAWATLEKSVSGLITSSLPHVVSWTMGFTNSIVHIALGIAASGFILYNKERLCGQVSRVCKVICRGKTYSRLNRLCASSNEIFRRFILGQITEAFVLGALCFLGMQLFHMPYALLISTVIAVTSLIPILGAFLGTIPCAFIILVINPPQALWFVLFIIILQQLESNLIYPRVVGSAVGLSGLWVLFAIVVGGGLFGLAGMLFGVPAFAVCYRLIGEWVKQRETSPRKNA